jgi:hypothetical protein
VADGGYLIFSNAILPGADRMRRREFAGGATREGNLHRLREGGGQAGKGNPAEGRRGIREMSTFWWTGAIMLALLAWSYWMDAQ